VEVVEVVREFDKIGYEDCREEIWRVPGIQGV